MLLVALTAESVLGWDLTHRHRVTLLRRNRRQSILPKTTTPFISTQAVITVSPTHSGKLAADLNSSTATTFFVIEFWPCLAETAYTQTKDPK